jgi:hypothetical protein
LLNVDAANPCATEKAAFGYPGLLAAESGQRHGWAQRKPYLDNYGLTRDILEGKRSSYLVEFELRFTGFGVEILTALKVSVIWNPGRLAGNRCRSLRNLHHIDLFFIVSSPLHYHGHTCNKLY